MSYVALGETYHNKIFNETLKEAHLAEIEAMNCSNALKERLRKSEVTVTVKFVYPPYGDFQQQKKGGPRPKFRANHKRAP